MTIGFNPVNLYRTKILIETGTYNGAFSNEMKGYYEKIHTIEVVDDFYNKAVKKFKNDNNIDCHFGDSPVVLEKILDNIKDPVTFWLDAHIQGGNQPKGTEKPLLRELDVISNHEIKDHMIMIDDVRLFGYYGTNKFEIECKLMEINPDYVIEYRMGFQKNDVVVARPDIGKMKFL